jgi:hypothetical protein
MLKNILLSTELKNPSYISYTVSFGLGVFTSQAYTVIIEGITTIESQDMKRSTK